MPLLSMSSYLLECQLEKQNGVCIVFQKNKNVNNACVKVPEVPVVCHAKKFKI